MCGIVGYINKKPVLQTIVNGLKRLEYRGYDSAGVAMLTSDNQLWSCKSEGKLRDLQNIMDDNSPDSLIGVGHTRWATHGAPSKINAHPHFDCKKEIALVHNGIIENYTSLKALLESKGHKFTSETDTEILAHLIEMSYDGDLVTALRDALKLVHGTFGLLILSTLLPNTILAAKRGSPLVVGVGDDHQCLASDGSAIVEHTKDVIYLEDNEMAIVTRDDVQVRTLDDVHVSKTIFQLPFDLEEIQKDGYSHYMLKEIYEQPKTIGDGLRGRLLIEEGNSKLGGLEGSWDRIADSERLIITACGTSWHSALIGEYLIEKLAQIPVEVEYASEFRYRDPIVGPRDTVIAISQSGETADTLAAIRETKRKGALSLGLCNVVGSTIARETDAGVYLHAGPEIGVASTKAFTSQVTVLSLIALYLGRIRTVTAEMGQYLVQELNSLPEKIEMILTQNEQIHDIAEQMAKHQNALYLGRGFNYPVALEGALKMKEISYIHAEGYPAAEMKHGPIALIDQNMPVVCMAIKDAVYEKVVSNIEEVKARGGRIYAIVNEGDTRVRELVEQVIEVPVTAQCLTPILTVIPLQLLAYHTAILKGCHVDQPRNLAKSVTVE